MHTRLLDSQQQLGISPKAIKSVVDVGLELGRQLPLSEVTLPAKTARGKELVAYEVPNLTRSWADAVTAFTDPLNGDRLPITFDNAAADGREDVALAHLGSRLVAQSMRLLRAEIWAHESEARLTRFTGRLVNDADLAEPAIIVDSRLVVMGIDGYRLHEEIFSAGGRLGGRGGFARLNVGEVKTALSARGNVALPRHHQDEIAGAWDRLAESVFAAAEARAEELRNGVMRLLKDRAETEITSLRTVMTQLRESISRELDEAQQGRAEQLSIFDLGNDRERSQVSRDVDALRRRLDEIPEEIERDAKRLRRRYANPKQAVFPAAITVLVPKRYEHKSLGIFERSRA